MKGRQAGVTIIGIGLFVIGLGTTILSLQGNVSALARLWPLVLAIFGVALLTQARSQRPAHGLILIGLVLLFSGLFLTLFSFRIGNLSWADMLGYWPIFLFLVGTSYMAVYLLGDMREQSLLIPAYLFGGSGIIVLPFTLGIIQGTVFNQMLRLWPLLVLLIGLAIFLRIRERRADQAND